MSEEAATLAYAQTQPKGKKIFRNIGLGIFFIAMLILFTVSKLPESKMTSLIQGYAQTALDPYGIYITDHGREFSVFRGFRYKLVQPTLELSDQTRVELDEVIISPKLLALLTGKAGATVILKQGNSTITVDGSGRGDKINSTLTFDQADLGKLGLLAYAASLKGSGILSGDVHVEGALSDLSSLTGNINLRLSKIHLDEQNLMGFQLPPLNVSEGSVNIPLDHGKLMMKDVHLGKGTQDDLQVNLTGDISLNRNLNSSVMNLRAVIGLSDKVKQSLSLLDSILGTARQQDGKYAYKINGVLASPFPMPDPNGK